MAANPIFIGAFSTLVGPYQVNGEDAMRGVELAINEFGGEVAGRRIVLYKESSNAIPSSAISAIETLIHKYNVDFTIGPLSGNEGLAVRDLAKKHPERTFLNGCSGTQDTTLRNPAPNFFNFMINGVQMMAGAGTYAYQTLGYRKVVSIAEDYSYPYTQVGSFMLEFCRAGGRVVDKFWVFLGKSSYEDIIHALPQDIDAIFLALGGSDAIDFYQQYQQLVDNPLPIFAGSITADQSVLGTGLIGAEYLVGMTSSGPLADDDPDSNWQDFLSAYRRMFPDALPAPALHCLGYYNNTKAALLALESIDCDLSNGQARFKEALTQLEFESPTGLLRLDHNRQAIGTNFVTIVVRHEDGHLYKHLIKKFPNINQTLGIPEEEYLQMKPFSRDFPVCE